MFREILRFELRQQLARPVTWLIFIAFAGLGALEMGGANVRLLGATDGVARGSPLVIATAVAMMCIVATLAAGTFAAAAALRDHDHRTAQLILSMSVSRRDYLGGRFAAAWLLVVLTMLACVIGIAVHVAMGGDVYASVSILVACAWAFVVIALPATLFVAALLFGLATFTRSLLVTFVGVACLIVLLVLSHALMHDTGSQALAALIDPFGYHTLQAASRYWTTAEINARFPPLDGWLGFNRVLWAVLALGLLGGLLLMRWNLYGVGKSRHGGNRRSSDVSTGTVAHVPNATFCGDLVARRVQWARWILFDARRVLCGAPFLALLLFAIIAATVNIVSQPTLYGVTSYPSTPTIVASIGQNITWLLSITLLFYAGELVWHERELGVAGVHDALPWPNALAVAAKACVLVVIVIVFLLAAALVGIAWQLLHGYTRIELPMYLGMLTLDAIPYVLFAWLCLAVQVACGKRFLGYLLSVLWLVLVKFGTLMFGWNDHLFWYATTPRALHSALNGYGRFLTPVLWFDLYWWLLALALLVVTVLLWPRDTAPTWRQRLRGMLARCGTGEGAVLAVALIGFVTCGAWIFHNTHVLNHVYDPGQRAQQLAHYEKAYGTYRNLPQPRITDETLSVAIQSHRRSLDIRGSYTLVNRSRVAIGTLLVWYPDGFEVDAVSFAPHTVVSADRTPHFVVYRLHTPMQPGASMQFGFHVVRQLRGFANEPNATYLVANGSFFDNLIGSDRSGHNVLPHIGYQPYLEVTRTATRHRLGLPPAADFIGSLNDLAARNINAAAGDADWIRADVTLSTSRDQMAITSGVLQRSWVANGRRYFHYVTRTPLPASLGFVSARYAVRSSSWHGITIDLYYNPAEALNAGRMLDSVRDALAWCSMHFGAYPRRELRVAVVPYNYAIAAEALPGMLVVRESGPAGPEAQSPHAGAIDPTALLLAHEVSHQWWAYQELPANVRGLNLITESLAQYSALMVMKQRYGDARVRTMLPIFLADYLRGRRRASEPESPLVDVGGASQGYIYYDKGALAMYALQDYVGEAAVNRAVKKFLDITRFKGPPYPVSTQFLDILDAEVGPNWRGLVDDLFRRITIFDDRMVKATAKKLPDGKYQVTMHVHAAKYYADGKGKQTRAKLDIPIEIGVFAKAKDGEERDEKPLYLKKYPVKDGDSTITVTVDGKPYQTGIDPFNELIDRVSSDNRAVVTIE